MDNNYNFYEFDLIYSQKIQNAKYSGRNIETCFNIYKRPESNKLNKRTDMYKLPNWIKLEEKRESTNPKRASDYSGTPNIRICSWGSNAMRTIGTKEEGYAKEIGIYIYKEELIEDLRTFIEGTNYEDFEWASKTQSPNITMWRIRQHIIEGFLKPNGLL